jgi:glycosyltransferase involved in cell wall biosynthesis
LRNHHRIGVVIPALNEERAISRVVGAIPRWVDEIVVVDNGSSDQTATVARSAGAKVVAETERGYGAACLAGVAALNATDIVVFLDGDFSDDPSEMHALVDPIVKGEADLVVGSRRLGNCAPGALTPQQRFGNWLACRLIHVIWRVAWTDLGPFRAIRRTALDELEMRDRRYGWTVEMQLKAARHRLRSAEAPVSYRRRIGVSKISGTLGGSIKAGATILRLVVTSALPLTREPRPGGKTPRCYD